MAALSVSLLYFDILIFSVSLLNGLLAQVVKFLELHVLASSAAPLPPSEESVTADARAVLEATPRRIPRVRVRYRKNTFRGFVITTDKCVSVHVLYRQKCVSSSLPGRNVGNGALLFAGVF